LEDVRNVIRRKAAESRTLVVCQMAVRRAITGETEDRLPLSAVWEGATVTHFGRFRGVDDWRDYEGVIVVGREQPPPAAAEEDARGIWFDDPKPLLLSGTYKTATRGYRLRSGEAKGARVAHCVHPDLRVQRVLELTRERGSAQAIDRLRLVHAESPKEVLILCNLPLDVTVDKLVSWPTVRDGGSRIARAYRSLGGALALVPGVLTTRFPELYPSQKSAEHDIRRTQFETPKTQIDSYCVVGVSNFRKRPMGRGGPRKWSRALLASDTEAARAQVEAAVAGTVEWTSPPTGEIFDPIKATMIQRWESSVGKRIFWTPSEGVQIEIARIGRSHAVVPFCAYDHDDMSFHDYIRSAPPEVQRADRTVRALLLAGNEIGWADETATANAIILNISGEPHAPGRWPENLYFNVLVLSPLCRCDTFVRPFLTAKPTSGAAV
jgi:hypothetical protein